MRVDIASNIMADLKRENEANVEYNSLMEAVVSAAEAVIAITETSKPGFWNSVDLMGSRVRALQEWKAKQ